MKRPLNLNRRQLILYMLATTSFKVFGGTFGPLKNYVSLGDQKMNMTIHRASTRGAADHGWLQAKHSFSFASWYNPERMGFGLLRVLNDDVIAPSMGFGTHPHQNMEIVTVPLRGSLQHKDSEGNQAVIRHGEVQLMSAGTGVYHSEFNASSDEDINLLQIWVLPEKENIKPRYDQKFFDTALRKNQWQKLVSPMDSDGEGVKINQQAHFSIMELDQAKTLAYQTHRANHGVYFFVIEGDIGVGNEILNQRDAVGIMDSPLIELTAKTQATVLAIEVPMS